MNSDELALYAQENAERFWRDAGNHWLNDTLDLRADSIVIDIGGYHGQWTDYVQRKYECYVDVYEPVVEYYEGLKHRFSHNPKIRVFNQAVDCYSGEGRIALMGEGSSLYNGFPPEGPAIQVRNIAEVVREIGDVELIAINCEGAEYSILGRLTTSPEIKQVRQLLIQFHTFYENAFEVRSRLREKLAITHYDAWSYPFCWERWVRR